MQVSFSASHRYSSNNSRRPQAPPKPLRPEETAKQNVREKDRESRDNWLFKDGDNLIDSLLQFGIIDKEQHLAMKALLEDDRAALREQDDQFLARYAVKPKPSTDTSKGSKGQKKRMTTQDLKSQKAWREALKNQ